MSKKKKPDKKSGAKMGSGQKKQGMQLPEVKDGNKNFNLLIAGSVVLLLIAVGLLAWALLGGDGEAEGEFRHGEEENGVAANLNGAAEGEQEAGQPPPLSAEGNPIVTIEMADGGIIRAELFPEIAPNTVNNFIYLVNQGFYDGLIFHRVIPGFMIQGGCPQGDGFGNPGYFIAGEFELAGFPNPLSHEPGVLSMARAPDPDSAGSQFFIVSGEARFLDGDYAAFGRVTEGMDVVERIVNTPRNMWDMPDTPQVMQRVTVDTRGAVFPPPVVTWH